MLLFLSFFVGEFGSSRKKVGQIRGLFSLGSGYLGPLETSAPSPWPTPSYVPDHKLITSCTMNTN